MARERGIFKQFLHHRIEKLFRGMDQDSKVRVENNGKFEYQSIFSVIQWESPFTNWIMNVSVLLDYNPSHLRLTTNSFYE